MLAALTSIVIPAPHSYADLRLIADEFECTGFEDMSDLAGADDCFVDEITAFDSRVKFLAKVIVGQAAANSGARGHGTGVK